MKTILVIAACLLAGTATCRAGSLAEIRVIDRDSGSVLHPCRHDGRVYVIGKPGHRYAVRIHNRSGARILAVLSVDGINAISGEDANPEQSGYVLGAYETTTVNGWRKSLSQIAEFNFTAVHDSYAARTGRPHNIGVIGVAIFREKSPRHPRHDRLTRQAPAAAADAATPAPETVPTRSQAKAASPLGARPDGSLDRDETLRTEQALGTGHGRRENSYARYTNFERATSGPQEIDSIWYDSYRNLAARGIVRSVRPLASMPQAFPNRFAPDPPARH